MKKQGVVAINRYNALAKIQTIMNSENDALFNEGKEITLENTAVLRTY